MLCPEVNNFNAPDFTLKTKTVPRYENNHLETINDLVFNHLVSVIIPTTKVPQNLIETLNNDCDYYKINNVKLSEFVNLDFVQNFVKSGCLYALTVGTRIDCDNCASLTPQGQLILNLNKETYQTSGLTGAVSHFHSITKEKYIVTIDLKELRKANSDRAKLFLDTIKNDVIVTWEPPNDTTCPSSIAKYFHTKGYKVQLCPIKHKTHVIEPVKIPIIECYDDPDFIEWLGMVSLRGNLTDGTPDNYVTTYETPEPFSIGSVTFLQWRGLFTTNQVTRLYNQISKLTNEWVAMYVQGFSDSVVAWDSQEHHFYTNGDNSYTFILSKDNLTSFIQQCSRKRYKNKRKGKPL